MYHLLNVFTATLVISLVILSHYSYFVKAENKLLAVAVLYRHGDRTPSGTYPNDPYKNQSYWPAEFGELTNIGRQQHYALGRWFRERYKSFLPSKYSPKDIHVLSSDADRCILSAGSNLAGLYPPIDDEIWNKDLLGQPVPIHTIPTQEDPFLQLSETCPKFDKVYDDLRATEYFKKIDADNQDLYEYLSKNLGENVTNFYDIYKYYDIFRVEELYNLTIPDWARKVYPDRLRPLNELAFISPTWTPELKRLAVGPLMAKIVDHLSNFAKEEIATMPKFLMLSSHESTIVDVLNSIEITRPIIVPYATSFIVELYSNGDNNKGSFVNLLFKNTTEAVKLNLKDCSFNCEFQEFVEILKPITVDVDKWRKECRVP